jgi:ABC-2 type transport system ATP-binding protein
MTSVHVSAEKLGKSFGPKRVLDDVSFAVQPGDVVGVLGKNGAGKTTLLELMLGFTPASTGSVRIFGHDSYRMPADAKARVGFVPQQDELLSPLSAGDQIRLIASFYQHWDQPLIERLCADWGVDRKARVRGMSVGERQKLSILLALGHRPDILILDEPVASLDPIARRQFLEQIVEVASDGQRSVVFSSHIVSDIERLANRIWILKEGRFYWNGDLDSLKESFVRVHIRGERALPEHLVIPHSVSVRRHDAHAIAVVSDWSESARAAIESVTGASVEVETLSLEEIFVELHR